MFTLPPVSTYPSGLATVEFYRHLLQAEPRLLGLTLSGITLFLLVVRLLDGRVAPLLFRVPALATAVLALASVAGLVPVAWPLGFAAAAVGLLLLDETVYLVATALGLAVRAMSELHADARRLLLRRQPTQQPGPVLRTPDAA